MTRSPNRAAYYAAKHEREEAAKLLIIQKAIDGGYVQGNPRITDAKEMLEYFDGWIEPLLLEARFWQAVGKVEGWEDCYCEGCNRVYPEYVNGCIYHETGDRSRHVKKDPFNRYHQYRMIDALAEGKTAGEHLVTLFEDKV